MYIVRFVRKDGKPDEEYYYHRLEDAQKHVDLFKDDDSGLYEKIEIVNQKAIGECIAQYLVQLISPDDKQDEEYWYDSYEEAEAHFSMLKTLDNDDYFIVQILKCPSFSVMERAILLGFTDRDLAIIRKYTTGEQFETAVSLLSALQGADESSAEELISARIKLAKLSPQKFLLLNEIIAQ